MGVAFVSVVLLALFACAERVLVALERRGGRDC